MATADELNEEGTAEPVPPKRSGKKLILIIVIGLLVLLGAAGGGLYASGLLGGKKPEATEAAAQAKDAARQTSFYDLPDLLVNLNTGGRKSSFLKIVVSLELEANSDEPKVKAVQPRIVDTFQTYLRELRPEDLRGSAGLARLREELLIRVNATVNPVKVDDVLFREMLVQ